MNKKIGNHLLVVVLSLLVFGCVSSTPSRDTFQSYVGDDEILIVHAVNNINRNPRRPGHLVITDKGIYLFFRYLDRETVYMPVEYKSPYLSRRWMYDRQPITAVYKRASNSTLSINDTWFVMGGSKSSQTEILDTLRQNGVKVVDANSA